ncbi:MAG: HU family DNA-binding protein [Thermodesulfobacteriota bacterium]
MNKSQLIEVLAQKLGLPVKKAEHAVDIFFDAVSKGLSQGDRAEIRGFGSFTVRNYKGYTGRNPKTGDVVEVRPKKLPFFKVGKELKEQVDSYAGSADAED